LTFVYDQIHSSPRSVHLGCEPHSPCECLFPVPVHHPRDHRVNPRQLIKSWLNGRAQLGDDGEVTFSAAAPHRHAEKFRRAYDWIASRALLTPYHDMEFGGGVTAGRDVCRVELPGSTGYASFVLLPLLNLLANRRLVFVG